MNRGVGQGHPNNLTVCKDIGEYNGYFSEFIFASILFCFSKY